MAKNKISLQVSRDTSNLREMALAKIKGAILTGYFKPNQRLVERALCDELDVSRTVVREILRYLEAQGLIENIPNKGPIVAPMDWDTTKQIYKIRLMIETEVATECAKNADEQTKQELYQALLNIKNNYNSEDIIKLIEAVAVFYKIIFDSTNQSVAWDIFDRINGKISRLRAITLSTDDRHIKGYQQMQKIYEGIKNNNPKQTELAIREHILDASKIAEKALKNKEQDEKQIKTPKGYWIADVKITDIEKYKQYTAITPEILKKYGAKILVRGGEKHNLEGNTNERFVVLEFKSVNKALECYNSPEYKKAKKLRQQACIANVSIIEGA